MRITLFSLFPEWFAGPLGESIIGRARQTGILDLQTVNPRDFATDLHKSVDDLAYGGGGGMVLRPDVLARALDNTIGPPGAAHRAHVIYMSPRGKPFNQSDARRLAALPSIAILCGHYEAVDQRLIDTRVDEEISLGDFVLTGGEIPAMAVVDAVARMIPEVLGNSESARTESFMNGLLEGPHYTRPARFEGRDVPKILLSGDHGAIAEWREKESLRVTAARRPDLLELQLLHPEDVRRLARRGRPFAVWRSAGRDSQEQLLFASAPVHRLFPDKAPIFVRRWEKGLSPGVRWAEIKEAFGESPAMDRASLKEELLTLDLDVAPAEVATFLRNLLDEMLLSGE